MKTAKLFILFIYAIGLYYLTIPSSVLPNLYNSTRSDEPGDTWQNPDQKGFYSNLSRAEVLKNIETQKELKFLGLKLSGYRLNYPPEESYTLVRDQLKSNYLEEIVFPFRESVFVNGWEPKNAPMYANRPAIEVPDLNYNGSLYTSKITLKPINSTIWSRILIWSLCFPMTYLVLTSVRKTKKLYAKS